MRKHHARWVALFSAAAISTTGLVAPAGPAAADDQDKQAFSWPVVSQGVSTYSLDGYEITYLPPGLDRYGINASSSTDHQGNRQSQISWVQGPDQLYGRVAVMRSESLQDLDDLRTSRYGHLADDSLEELDSSESFEHGAYLSEATGDLFWVDGPGVAITTHLQPDRWRGSELVKLAESVSEEVTADAKDVAIEEADGSGEAEGTQGTEEAPVTDEAASEEDAADEAPAEEAPADETPADEAPSDEAPAEEAPADETPAEEAPADEAASEEDAADEAPAEEAPADEAPDEAAVDEETVEEEAPAEDVQEEAGSPAGTDLPDGVSSREVKTCLIDHFVDFDSGQTDLDQAQMTPKSGKFVERALSQNDLDEAEHDRLLATVWYYGNENDKVAAINDCAERFDLERGEVENVLAEVADLIGQLAQEAEESLSKTMDEVQESLEGGEAPADDVTDPVDAHEWEELWNSLPWSLPAESS